MKWKSHNIFLRPKLSHFPSGSAYRSALLSGIDAWNDTPSKVNYQVLQYDASVKLGNGESEVYWSVLDPDALAVTYCFGNLDCTYSETDIAYNVLLPFSTSTAKSQLKPYMPNGKNSFRTTTLHELGHAQGLDHEGDEYNVMGLSQNHVNTNGWFARTYVGEDTILASMNVYGKNSGTYHDLGVVHWRFWKTVYVEDQLPYSAHDRTRVFQDGKVADVFIEWKDGAPKNSEPVFKVDSGATIQVEFTFEHNGKGGSVSTFAKYYLSTNDYITTGDDVLGQATFNQSMANVYTRKQTLTLPSNLKSGKRYWIGVIVDPNNDLAETYESNNRTYVGICVN